MPDSRSSSPQRIARSPAVAEREAIRRIVEAVAWDAHAVHDEVSFTRLVRSLDERAADVLRIVGRS